MSLRRLGLERIDLMQLHRVDANFPLEDQLGELVKMKDEGKIGHIGLSEVDVEQLKAAQQIAPIVSVQNLYNLANRSAEAVLDEARPKASRSSRGSRWRPVRSPPPTGRCTSWPSTMTRHRRNWRWRGCSSVHR